MTRENDTHVESHRVRFGPFEADLRGGELYRDGRKVPLQEQPFQVLALLLENPGELVTREDLSRALWPEGTFVDFDRGLNTAVNKLRSALRDSAESPRFVETVARRGYRFVASVEAATPAPTAVPAQSRQGKPRRWPQATAVLVLVVAAALLARSALQPSRPVATPPEARLMLAVLPFVNLSNSSEHEFFSDGLTEELIGRLGGMFSQRLGVIARTTVMHYKNTPKSIDQIAEELGVDYVLEGSVRRGEGRLRVTAQLIQVSDQTHLWAESYDSAPEAVLATQLDVARRVARSLALEMLPEDDAQAPNVDAQAYESFLKGRHFRDMVTEAGLRKGIEHFDQAVARDPNFAQAYAAIGGCYCLLSGHGLEVNEPGKLMPNAKAMAERALTLDAGLAEAHGVLAMSLFKYEWDWEGAEKEFKRAIQLNPSYALAHIWYSFFLSSQGRHDDALEHAQTARELDMFSRAANLNVAWQLYEARRYGEAIEQFSRTLELFPGLWAAHLGRGLAFAHDGSQDRALQDLEQAVNYSGSNNSALGGLGYAYAKFGVDDKAREALTELIDRSANRYVPPSLVAGIYGALGQLDSAFEWLEKAYEVRSRSLVWLNVAHEFDSLRADARFEEIARRMGLNRSASAAARL